MTIAKRLYLGFSLLLLLMLVITLVGVVKVNIIDSTLTRINEMDSLKQRYAINFRGSVHDRAIAIRDAVLAIDQRERQTSYQAIDELAGFYAESAILMDEMFALHADQMTDEEVALLGRIKEIEAAALPLTDSLRQKLDMYQIMDAETLLREQLAPIYTDWLAAINAFIDYQEARIGEGIGFVRGETAGFQFLMLAVTLVALLIGVLISYSLVKRILRTIGGEPETAARVIREVAAGNLQQTLPDAHPASIMGAVRSLSIQLSEIIREVTRTSDALVDSAHNLAETASANEQRIDLQREQTTQGAAAINQMSATVQEVASHAAEASNLARTADRETGLGSADVQKTIATIDSLAGEVERAAAVIDQLSVDSSEIGAVLEVIEGIAEQTNLLALNAAIEAARAGEHGRGFAVVADEVRALASRTQESTRDIQQRIEKMQQSASRAVSVMEQGRQKAAESVNQARDAGKALEIIQASVTSINDMNAQIASAAEEQSAVADEINQNFSSITEISEETAQGSEQVTQASHALRQLAAALQQSVARFKL